MITRKQTYQQWFGIRMEIDGHVVKVGEERKSSVVGLKNEDVTQGVALRLNRIVKKINGEFETLQKGLDEIKADDPEAVKKRTDLWKEEIEISFEPVDIAFLDIKRKDNFEGNKYDYTSLIDIICE